MSLNFSLILFWLLILTGLAWLLDAAVLKRRRFATMSTALNQFDEQARLQGLDHASMTEQRRLLRESHLRQPPWIEVPAGFFPVIFVVFFLRSFLFEPFRIPSGSMIPTLEVGDLILVNKFAYGLRLPILNTKVLNTGHPTRGEVMVFRYPKDPSVDYIKRVIGLPGDHITYANKRLTINGQAVETSPMPDYFDTSALRLIRQFRETLPAENGTVTHRILNDDSRAGVIEPENFPFSSNCTYSNGNTTVSCTVPADQYFMMGDNRDNSADSRYWGFVPDQNIVGKAFFIWMNFGNIKRIGRFE